MKNLLFVFTAFIVTSCATTPKWQSLSQAIHDHSVVKKNIVHEKPAGEAKPDGSGPVPYLKALGAPPKKVALVSLYVIDPVTHHEAKNISTAQWMEISHAKAAANHIFKNGFPAMKQQFALHGMDLLSPAEFLTDEKKKTFYANFKPKHGPPPVAWAKTFLHKMTRQHKTVMQAADGFSEIYLMSPESVRAGTHVHDETLANSLGSDLTKGLDVDAVVVILSQFTVQDKATVLDETSMYMFGPNPVIVKGHAEDHKHGHKHVGHQYIGLRAPFEFVYLGDTMDPSNYEGYGKLLTMMSQKLGELVELHMK